LEWSLRFSRLLFTLFLLCAAAIGVAQTRSTAPPVWRAEVDALKVTGDAAAAVAKLKQLEQTSKPSAALEDEMGFLLAVLNRGPEAIDRFRKAPAIDPNFAAAHYHLGVALWLAGNHQEAVPSLGKAARIGPKIFDFRYTN